MAACDHCAMLTFYPVMLFLFLSSSPCCCVFLSGGGDEDDKCLGFVACDPCALLTFYPAMLLIVLPRCSHSVVVLLLFISFTGLHTDYTRTAWRWLFMLFTSFFYNASEFTLFFSLPQFSHYIVNRKIGSELIGRSWGWWSLCDLYCVCM